MPKGNKSKNTAVKKKPSAVALQRENEDADDSGATSLEVEEITTTPGQHGDTAGEHEKTPRELQQLYDLQKENLRMRQELEQVAKWKEEQSSAQTAAIKGKCKAYMKHPDLQKYNVNKAPVM